MNTLSYILFLIIFVLIAVLLYLLFFKKKKDSWDNDKFNLNNKDYTLDYLEKTGLPKEILDYLIYKIEATTYLEKCKEISDTSLNDYIKRDSVRTPIAVFKKKLNHLFNKSNIEVIDLKEVTKVLHIKSKMLIETLENYDGNSENELNHILITSFKLNFIYYDLIDYLQNGSWAKADSILGLQYLLDKTKVINIYDGNKNVIKYDKSLLYSYQILKKHAASFDDNLFLGYKFK